MQRAPAGVRRLILIDFNSGESDARSIQGRQSKGYGEGNGGGERRHDAGGGLWWRWQCGW
jgi:hypothetical protein